VDLEIDNGSMIPYYENMEYDGIGNITSYTTRKNGSARNYQISYGDARFPILPTDIEVTGSQPLRETFTYDHSGSRIQRELDADNNPATANEISYFIPFGTENLAELDARGRVRRAYSFAGGERTGYKAAGRTVLYLKDHLGSSKMTLGLYASTLQEGLLQRAGDADPYGVTWRESYAATAESEPHQYTGQEREAALDLYYYGARFYDPELGRFLAVDPKREFENGYSFVANYPAGAIDSTGKDIEILIGGPYAGHPFGHVALRVFGKGYDFVYDFGRYGKVWGTGGSKGEGMLRIWKDSFKFYIAGENATERETKGFIYSTTPEQDKTVIGYFGESTKGTSPVNVRTDKKNGLEMKQYRLNQDYHGLEYNCTTVATDGFEFAFPDVSFENTTYNVGRGLNFLEKTAAKLHGWPDTIFMPMDLLAFIQSGKLSVNIEKAEKFKK
jgi:RHS repeat-associated protein